MMPPKQSADASTGVAALVASIKQHKKFRQLASYSVQCLQRAVTPPTVGWQKNLKVRPPVWGTAVLRAGGSGA